MVSVLSANPSQCLHFVTGTSAPCISVFKPVWIDSDVPSAAYQPFLTLWRTHEVLHRHVLADYGPRAEAFRAARIALEQRFVESAIAATAMSLPFAERLALSTKCWTEASQALLAWRTQVTEAPSTPTRDAPLLYLLVRALDMHTHAHPHAYTSNLHELHSPLHQVWQLWSRRVRLGGKIDMCLRRYRPYLYVVALIVAALAARRSRAANLLLMFIGKGA